MLELAKEIRTSVSAGNNNRNASERWLCEDRPEAESKSLRGVEPGHATSENKAGKEVFFL